MHSRYHDKRYNMTNAVGNCVSKIVPRARRNVAVLRRMVHCQVVSSVSVQCIGYDLERRSLVTKNMRTHARGESCVARVVKGVYAAEPSVRGVVAPGVLHHRRTQVVNRAAEHSMVVARLMNGRRWRCGSGKQRFECRPILVANNAVQIIRGNGTDLVVQAGGDVSHTRVTYARHYLSHAYACGAAVHRTADPQTLLQRLHVFSFGTNSVCTMLSVT